jgi:hypothetical protein
VEAVVAADLVAGRGDDYLQRREPDRYLATGERHRDRIAAGLDLDAGLVVDQ